ncbi:enoyl-CoA hydratase/isomerase family protein [Gracilimonas mengyeensis]|uniref:Methylglutaconyl-CoA hydratase n=1 Tax=Gracilimonas mengyeensis TaxID=1302730 RepID=A0A521E329_9BACT|nr:enoyl-CoA hydratase/isomerase family protein [Gracilimonas mengyeensis]SMO78353.1 methylglutaconyl-CoA hydratase [Gracilimonas mengyeensis]
MSEQNGTVNLTIENHIGTIEFYHPKGNSLPGKLLRELAQTITDAGENDEIRVVIIKSRGEGAFCAGASFDELIAIEDYETGKEFFMGFALVLNAMRTCPKLIIVRVHGKTVGGGVGIASAGDYTFAHADAAVKLSELALGIGPFVVGPAVERKVGTSAFSAMSIDAANWYGSDFAEEKGMFNKVFDTTEELDEAVQNLGQQLAKSSPEAMKNLKAVLWKGTGDWDLLLEQRAEISGRLVLSDFTKNFIKKFKEKS